MGGAASDGAGADLGAAADGTSRAGWNVDGGTRAAGGNLRRIGSGKEHIDWDDGAEYRGGPTVVGLVGERGREVREFVEDSLGEEGRKRSVVLVSTSDQSPLLRMRAAMAATSVAEFYAAQGKHVLLVLDSLTRYAMAAREIGLAAGSLRRARDIRRRCLRGWRSWWSGQGIFRRGALRRFTRC